MGQGKVGTCIIDPLIYMLVILSCLNQLPLNHKGVLCAKNFTTGRLLTEISPYATWSSTLPWITSVSDSKDSNKHTLARFILFTSFEKFN